MKEIMSNLDRVALGGTHLELVEGWLWDAFLMRGGGEINNRKGVIE